jgi:hypothetical protein
MKDFLIGACCVLAPLTAGLEALALVALFKYLISQ